MLKRAAIEKTSSFLDHLFWAKHEFHHSHLPDWCNRLLFSVRPPWERMVRSSFSDFPGVKIDFATLTEEIVERADLVVPLEFSDLQWLADRPDLVRNKPIPVPSRKLVELCHDKPAFNAAVIDLGFSDLIPSMEWPLDYPYIVKPSRGENSNSTFVIRSPSDEVKHAALLADSASFRQEMLAGPVEYATHMAIRKGKMLAELTIEYRFDDQLPVKGSDRYIRRAISCPDSELLANVLRALGYEGLCCFNYKMISNKIKLIELNPRFGGSLAPHFKNFLAMME